MVRSLADRTFQLRLRAAGSFFAAHFASAVYAASSPGGSPAGTAHRGRIVRGYACSNSDLERLL